VASWQLKLPWTAAASILAAHPAAAFICAVLSTGFIAGRGWSLHAATKLAGGSSSFTGSVRTFAEGAVVDAVTWPGKLWADAYRASKLSGSWALRLRAIAAWRIAIAAANGLLAAAALALTVKDAQGPAGEWSITVVVAALAWLSTRRTRMTTSIAAMGALSLAASLCDIAMMSILAWAVAGVNPMVMAPRFVLASMVAAGSGVPMGLGVLDGACYLMLTAELGVESTSALAVVGGYRLLGPVLTLTAGIASLLLGGASRKAELSSQPDQTLPLALMPARVTAPQDESSTRMAA
jgi:hypothetical protein